MKLKTVKSPIRVDERKERNKHIDRDREKNM